MLLQELTPTQKRELLQLLVSELTSAENPKEEVIKGVKGILHSDGPMLCPEMCFRFQEFGKCVHLKTEPGIKPTFTKAYETQVQERRDRKIKAHKDEEDPKAHWVHTSDWKTLPYDYGVYIWVDTQERLLFVAKAIDMRRRHFTWSSTKDKRFDVVAKIWWLHTGWYNEVLAALSLLPPSSVITLTLLEEVLMLARPIEALLPEPPVS